MRAAAESSRMRSFVCCGVSSTACARLGGGRTRNPRRVVETRHNVPAPSLAGCMRIDDPQLIIQGEVRSPSVISMPVARASRFGNRQSGLLNLASCKICQKKEEEGIGGNVQIEVGEAVGEKSETGHEGGELESGSKG